MANESLGELDLKINIDWQKLNQTLDKVNSSIKKSSDKMKSVTKSSFSGLTSIASSVGGGLISIFTSVFSKIFQIIKKAMIAATVAIVAVVALSIKAAAKQEDALFALQTALSLTGDASEAVMNDFQKFASEIQKVTIHGDEETLALLAMHKQLGVNSKDLKKAAKWTIGLAAATGRSTETMTQYVALALKGEFSMLRRYIPALRETTNKTEQLAIVTKFAADGFKVAEGRALTTTGVLKQLWNVIGDVTEVMGEPLLSPIKKAGSALKDFLNTNTSGFKTRIKEISDAFTFKIDTEGIMPALKDLGKLLIDLIKVNTIAWAKSLGEILVPIFKGLAEILVEGIARLLPQKIAGFRVRYRTKGEKKEELKNMQNELKLIDKSKETIFLKGIQTFFNMHGASQFKGTYSQRGKSEFLAPIMEHDYTKLLAIELEKINEKEKKLKEEINFLTEDIKSDTGIWGDSFNKFLEHQKNALVETKKVLNEYTKNLKPEFVGPPYTRPPIYNPVEEKGMSSEFQKGLSGASTSFNKRRFQGFKSSGEAVSLTGQELFANKDLTVNKLIKGFSDIFRYNTKSVIGAIINLGTIISGQPSTLNKIKETFTGQPSLVELINEL